MSTEVQNTTCSQHDAKLPVSGSALNGWIKLNGIPGEMQDCDCWVLRDDGEIFLSPKGEFIAIGDYEYYQPIIKPKTLPNDFKVT